MFVGHATMPRTGKRRAGVLSSTTRTSVRRRAVALAAAGVVATAAGAARACAPTPVAAAERYVQARARCDFVAAWDVLAPAERQAAQDDLAGWSQLEAEKATENLGCRHTVEGFELTEGGGPADAKAVVRYVAAVPVVVQEFQRLLEDRERADVLAWRRLDAAILDARLRILQAGTWEPRARIALSIQAVRVDGAWCIDDRIAALAEWKKERAAARERERTNDAERRRAEQEKAEALSRRAEAALPLVTAEAVRVGQSITNEPGVWAEILNRSRETLAEVEVRIDYLDTASAVVGQKTFAAILAPTGTDSTRFRTDRPLPPGQRRPFGVRAQDAPSTWARRARVTVVRVEVDPRVEPSEPAPAPAAAAAPAQRPGTAPSR
jgi:hypothetical protein